jgi:hypothetical protein
VQQRTLGNKCVLYNVNFIFFKQGTKKWLQVKMENFGSVGIVYFAGGPKNGVMVHFRDISTIRVEEKVRTNNSKKKSKIVNH